MTSPGRFYPFGYLLMLAPPLLLVGGMLAGMPYLLFVVLFGVAPLMRALLGNIPEEPAEWGERVTTLLDRLPVFAAIVGPVALLATLVQLRIEPMSGPAHWVGFALSLWAFMLCAIPVAHELIHRRGLQRTLGGVLAGITGYPILEGEHIRHHSMSGIVEVPEWPRRDESVWSFVGRRMPHAIASAVRYQAMLRASRGYSLIGPLIATLLTLGAFVWAAGASGAVVYLCVAAGVHFGVHAINYLQHWALGSDSVDGAEEARFGWECRCLLQGWVMLNIALHHAHHQNSATPYYRLVPHKGSPRLPGSYIPMLFVSLVPALWRRMMEPALATWQRDPELQREPIGRRIICLPVHYSDERADAAAGRP
jgi:alkane 1-monooxygenase